MQHEVHHATFNYNYVNRAVWGEKWCTTPLQDLDETHSKKASSMRYSTVKPEDNHLGKISHMAWKLGIMLTFIKKYDPEWMENDEWEFIHPRQSSTGVTSNKHLRFKRHLNVAGISLEECWIHSVVGDPNKWENTTSFKSFCDFVYFNDIFTDVSARFNKLLVEQAPTSFGKNFSNCCKALYVEEDKVFSAARISTLTGYANLVTIAIDYYLGVTRYTREDIQELLRFDAIGDEAVPIRRLVNEVLTAVENQNKEIL